MSVFGETSVINQGVNPFGTLTSPTTAVGTVASFLVSLLRFTLCSMPLNVLYYLNVSVAEYM